MKRNNFSKYYSNKQKDGKKAEEKASAILQSKKISILARNIRFYGTEIDFLCKKNDLYFLFEVKKMKKIHYKAGYLAFSYMQWLRYRQSINKWYTDIKKINSACIGLILFDEYLQLMDFQENIFFP